MTNLKGMNHAAINVRDFQSTKDFYEKILGFERLPRPPFGIDGAWYKCGESQFHVIESKDGNREWDHPKGTNPTSEHVALVVEDLGLVRTLLDQARMTYDLIEQQVGDVTIRAIYVSGPDGHCFELRESYPMPKG